MTYDEIVHQIPKLSVQERLRLMEMLTRSLQLELAEPLTQTPGSAERLLGIIAIEGESPTDEQIREDYTDYLMKKYS